MTDGSVAWSVDFSSDRLTHCPVGTCDVPPFATVVTVSEGGAVALVLAWNVYDSWNAWFDFESRIIVYAPLTGHVRARREIPDEEVSAARREGGGWVFWGRRDGNQADSTHLWAADDGLNVLWDGGVAYSQFLQPLRVGSKIWTVDRALNPWDGGLDYYEPAYLNSVDDDGHTAFWLHTVIGIGGAFDVATGARLFSLSVNQVSDPEVRVEGLQSLGLTRSGLLVSVRASSFDGGNENRLALIAGDGGVPFRCAYDEDWSGAVLGDARLFVNATVHRPDGGSASRLVGYDLPGVAAPR